MELDSELDELMPDVAHKVMVQLALQKGLKDTVTKELWQVHIQNVFSPRKLESLTPQ